MTGGDVWRKAERWNRVRDIVFEPRNTVVLDLLYRHTPWVLDGECVCDTCERPWPCMVFTEIEAVL